MKRRRPSTVGQFAFLGLWRGAVAGGALGIAAGVVLAIAAQLSDDLPTDTFITFIMLAAGYGLVTGVALGLGIGTVVGVITGSFRGSFDALWPVSAAVVFLLTFVSGGTIAFLDAFTTQEQASPWGRALVGGAWALGLAAVLAVAAGLGSMGVHGSKRTVLPPASPLQGSSPPHM